MKDENAQAEETRFSGKYQRTVLDTIYQAYRPALVRGILYLLIGLVGRVILLGNSNLMGYWADFYCSPHSGVVCRPLPEWLAHRGPSGFVDLLIAATAIGFVLTYLFRLGVSRLSAEAVSLIYDETTLRTSRLPISFFDRHPAGRVMTRFSSDYNNVFRIFGGPLAEFLTLVFDLMAMTVLITIASPWLLPLWLTQAVLNTAAYYYFRPRLRIERRELARARSPGIAHFSESANGAGTIRAFGRQSVFRRRFAELNDAYLGQKKKATKVFLQFSLTTNLVTASVLLATALLSIRLAHSGRISVGSIGVAFVYLGLSAGILQSFFEWLGQFEEAMTGVERMDEYLRLDLEDGAKLPRTARFRTPHPRVTDETDRRPPSGGAPIQIEGLVMRYAKNLPPVLSGIDLSIRPGEKIAIVGKTGSGKTSLIQALFRLYPLESGVIRVAGFEAETGTPKAGAIDLKTYRSLLSYITQDATLFLGSLRENLDAIGNLEDRELARALRRVHFLPDATTDEEFLHWLDFSVQERGRNLSSGERQLVCMARCLLQDAPVVILDEATSAVDPKSEEILTRATEEFFRGKTQILIAHRLSTIRSCDRVVWLQAGSVHRLGPPDEVLGEFEHADLDV